MDLWQDTLSEILHQCTCACIPVYVLMAMGQSRDTRFSDQQSNLCALLFLCKPSWYNAFVDNSQCSCLQELPDVRSSWHYYIHVKWQIDFQILSSNGNLMYHAMRQTQPIWNPSRIKTNHQRLLQALLTWPKSALCPKSKTTAECCSQVCRQGFPWIELSAALR